MSIQDESFPDDEFLNELNFSTTGQRFQFPHHHRQKLHKPSPLATNTSESSSTDQNLSGESTNGRPSSGLSSKTTESEPANLAGENATQKEVELIKTNQSKAISYQDIHTEYTKRRYKHVESKVGQYIANLKAEDQKRRNSKFQRHHSMPDHATLSGAGANTDANRHATQVRYSAAELRKMDESASDIEADSSENMTGSSSSRNRNESSDDANAANVDFIDKQTYAKLVSENERIQSYSDYLQMKLDEKTSENMRLKRNVEFMRIELGNCQDKLKKQIASSGVANTMGGSYGNIAMSGNGILRHSLQGLLHCQTRCSQSTQTEIMTPIMIMMPPPAPPTHATPISLDSNNNNNNNTFEYDGGVPANSKNSGRSVATIQPLSLNFSNIIEQDSSDGNGNGVLRQRTNSNSLTKVANGTRTLNASQSIHNSLRSCLPPSSSDSAIEVELLELATPKPSMRNLLSPKQLRGEEFIYYDERTGRFAAIQTRDASGNSYDDVESETNVDLSSPNINADRTTKKKRKMPFLRRRWLRFFGPCTRCDENNQNLDSSAIEQSYTQIPLFDKSFENRCQNFQ